MSNNDGIWVAPEIEGATKAWAEGERELVCTVSHPVLNDDGTAVLDDEGNLRVERVHVTMPSKPNVGMALAYLKMARKQGVELAASWILEEALGEDGYDAIAAEPDLDPDMLKAIVDRVTKRALGGLDDPKGR